MPLVRRGTRVGITDFSESFFADLDRSFSLGVRLRVIRRRKGKGYIVEGTELLVGV